MKEQIILSVGEETLRHWYIDELMSFEQMCQKIQDDYNLTVRANNLHYILKCLGIKRTREQINAANSLHVKERKASDGSMIALLRSALTKERLESFLEQGLTSSQIADALTKELGCYVSVDAVQGIKNELGVSNINRFSVIDAVGESALRHWYIEELKSVSEIAQLLQTNYNLSVSDQIITGALQTLKIKRTSEQTRTAISCKLAAQWDNPDSGLNSPDYKEKQSHITKARWKDPEDYLNSSECREKQSTRAVEDWKDPVYRTNHVEALNRPEVKEKMSVNMINRWNDPDDYLNSQENKDVHSAALTKRWNDPDGDLNTPEFREKMLHATHAGREMTEKEKAFARKLTEVGLEFEREFPIVDDEYRFVYDFKVGNTLIEINPSETHNVTKPFKGSEHMSIDYHLKKSLCAIKHGYRCFHIFDWQDPDKYVKLLLPRKSIYARKCKVKVISQEEANGFLRFYHLQGGARGQTYCVGLFYENVLVSVMTFGKPRYNKHYEWELIRFASSMNITGGAKKLWFKFLADNLPNSVLSYCDFSRFSGDTYRKLGFKDSPSNKKLSPCRHWWDPSTEKQYTDNFIRQRGFDQLFNAHFGKGTDNNELLRNKGLVEVYDCGQLVFEVHKEDYDTEEFRKHVARNKAKEATPVKKSLW